MCFSNYKNKPKKLYVTINEMIGKRIVKTTLNFNKITGDTKKSPTVFTDMFDGQKN